MIRKEHVKHKTLLSNAENIFPCIEILSVVAISYKIEKKKIDIVLREYFYSFPLYLLSHYQGFEIFVDHTQEQ